MRHRHVYTLKGKPVYAPIGRRAGWTISTRCAVCRRTSYARISPGMMEPGKAR